MELLQVQHQLLWALPDSGLFGQDTGLATCLLQLRPLLQLLDKEGGQEQGAGLQCSVVWASLDCCLPWLGRLLLLSLSRDTAELLPRRIVVH